MAHVLELISVHIVYGKMGRQTGESNGLMTSRLDREPGRVLALMQREVRLAVRDDQDFAQAGQVLVVPLRTRLLRRVPRSRPT